MSKEKELYRVEEGRVRKANPTSKVDWKNSALVLAKTPKEALRIAEQYDKGQVQWDNAIYRGENIVAIDAPESARCPDGYHWVEEHTRDRYIHVKAHCARDPRRR